VFNFFLGKLYIHKVVLFVILLRTAETRNQV